MKLLFGLTGLLFLAMYAGAQLTLERPPHDRITHLHWATDPNPARTVQTALFDRLYPRDDVTVDPGPANDASKLIVQCATGTGPDIVDVYSQSQMTTLVNAGILLDLTPYAQAGGFDTGKTYPSLRGALTVDGHQYRFPCNVWANCVVYNKRIFDDHGVPYPRPGWTYADFVRTAEEIRDRPSKSGQTHMPVANWSNVQLFEDMLIGHGGRLFSPDGLTSALDAPPAVAALQSYADMMYRDKILPTPAEAAALSSQGGWGSGGLNWFSEGKAAMIVIGRWYIVQVPNYPALRGALGAVTLPCVPGRPSSGVTDSRAAGINVKSPHWREALRFLQFLAGPQYGDVIARDGDALPPSPAVARTGKNLANTSVPDPAFHASFIEAERSARPLDVSPYLDATEVDRWLGDSIEKVENRLETPPQALHALAAQINEQIRLNLERRPDLRRRAGRQ